MSGIYFHMRLEFPTAETVRQWRELALLTQRDHLEAVPGFDAINIGDDDLLGGEITVGQQTELDAAIAYLHQIGFPVDKSRILEGAMSAQQEIAAMTAIDDVVGWCLARLRTAPESYCADPLAPHPHAARLSLPNGRPAPDCLRLWAAFDNYYPLRGSRSNAIIADNHGVLVVEPMQAVLRWVCLESIMDEIEDDEDTQEYLSELVAGFVGDFPGYGVVLAEEYPDPLLWIPPAGEPTVIWYHRDAFDRRQAFSESVAAIGTAGAG
ncbi:hypothetical protein [Streptomyces sp. NPDC007264]|uniref:hypothetical protein n=1 Tax=Streptomyces sp. NPDC007264 TaxID=3364777 RepID=UPI0036DCEED4